MKGLVIEDNISQSMALKNLLSQIADIDCACDGEVGVYMAESNLYDFITLDLMMPKINGIQALKKIREKSICPIIIVSGLNDIERKVETINLGADDYITKPYNDEELLARIKAILRRCNGDFYEKYQHDGMLIDYHNKMMSINNEYIRISGKTYEVIEYLVRNRNIIIPKEQLYNRVWGLDSEIIPTVPEVYVCNIRKLLKKYGKENHLKTIKNIGYMWQDKQLEE